MSIANIELALKTYFDVMYECDMKKFDLIFHPSCSLFTVDPAGLRIKTYEQYRIEMSTRNPPSASSQSHNAERIVKIDLLSADLALAQVRLRIHEKTFVDNLNLANIACNWMVVAKIYHLLSAPTIQAD